MLPNCFRLRFLKVRIPYRDYVELTTSVSCFLDSVINVTHIDKIFTILHIFNNRDDNPIRDESTCFIITTSLGTKVDCKDEHKTLN